MTFSLDQGPKYQGSHCCCYAILGEKGHKYITGTYFTTNSKEWISFVRCKPSFINPGTWGATKLVVTA